MISHFTHHVHLLLGPFFGLILGGKERRYGEGRVLKNVYLVHLRITFFTRASVFLSLGQVHLLCFLLLSRYFPAATGEASLNPARSLQLFLYFDRLFLFFPLQLFQSHRPLFILKDEPVDTFLPLGKLCHCFFLTLSIKHFPTA